MFEKNSRNKGKSIRVNRMSNKKNICQDADQVLEKYIEELSVDTSHHRMLKQENKCGYGLAGVCCKLCSNGPCRLSPARPKGVCGADADTIAARNFLRQVAAGSGCYIHVVENAAKELRQIAKDRCPIKGQKTLHRLAKELGITGFSDWDLAGQIADQVLEDLRRPQDEQMELIKKFAYKPRLEAWEKTGILPGGAKDEIFNAVVKSSTNLNSDPVNMLLHCLRLGISTGAYGLVLTNLLNDIMLGEGEIGFDQVGIGVVNPDYVNIMATGHQHAFYNDLQEYLVTPEVQKLAEQAGAKGVRIVGCTCVGQDFQLRKAACTEAFCGHAGNNYTSEAVLMTGCIDLVVSEFNCTIPGIEPICDELQIPQICLDDVAKKPAAESVPYHHEERRAISQKIAATAISAYASRKEHVASTRIQQLLCQLGRELGCGAPRINPMQAHGCPDAITGVTEVSLKNFLGGSWEPLIDLIKQGKIKGIAGVVGCSNLRAKGHDVFTVELTKQLIAKDILVLSAGCTCGGLENTGLMSPAAAELAGGGLREVCQSLGIPPVLNFGPCLAIGRMDLLCGEIAAELGVDFPQLPVVLSAPQWLEEQALADGAFALSLGFTLHLGLPPFVTGSPVIHDVLANQMKDITGGRLIVDTDITSSADRLEAVILEKRAGLGL